MKVPDDWDPARWRVYADWLVDRGNPHGERLNRMLDGARPLVGIESLPEPVRAIEARCYCALRRGAPEDPRRVGLGLTRVRDEAELDVAVAAGARALSIPDSLLNTVADTPVTELWPVVVTRDWSMEELGPHPRIERLALVPPAPDDWSSLFWILGVCPNLQVARVHTFHPPDDRTRRRAARHARLHLEWRDGPTGPGTLPALRFEASGPDRSRRDLQPGERVDRFVILGCLGGSVDERRYRAWDPAHSAEVTLRMTPYPTVGQLELSERDDAERIVLAEGRPLASRVLSVLPLTVAQEAPARSSGWAARSVHGLRVHKEDGWVAQDGVFAVIDAMGGHEPAIPARDAAVAAMTEGGSLRERLDRADQAIRAASEQGDMAVVLCALHRGAEEVAWVGDARAYRLRRGRLQQLSDDHSLVRRLVRDREIAPHEARSHAHSNIVLRALGVGGAEASRPEVAPVDIAAGDRLLLCTDGLWRVLDDPTLHALLERHARPDAAVAHLIEEAERGGATTNITALVIDL